MLETESASGRHLRRAHVLLARRNAHLRHGEGFHLHLGLIMGLIVEGGDDVCLCQFERLVRLLDSHRDVPLVVDSIIVDVLPGRLDHGRRQEVLRLISDCLEGGVLICNQVGILVHEEKLGVQFVLVCDDWILG